MSSDRSRSFVRVRGRSFIAFVLAPEPPLADWLASLDSQITRAPTFFAGRPVILDLSALSPTEPGLNQLAVSLHTRGIRVVGTEGVDAAGIDPVAIALPEPLNGGRPAGFVDGGPDAATPEQASTPQGPTAKPQGKDPTASAAADRPAPAGRHEAAFLLLDKPVRSGQTVLFPGGDVTVIGSVASGAEVIAGGSVHIYGALRGRVIAGLMGHPNARVFCRRLEAELLAIDGRYKTADDMPPSLRGKPVQAWLEGDTIMLAGLE